MKRHLLALCVLLSAGTAKAGDVAPGSEPLVAVNPGYAFDHPETLLRQRIFGLAHGVHLLLSACLDRNEDAVAAQQAYDAWYAAQRDTLDRVRQVLAEHHFGAQAKRAHWQDVAQTLGLKETIYPSLGAVSLQEACATLPQALVQPRYDFAAQLETAHEPAAR